MDSVRDLGPLDGPVLVFGGPYGNLEATEAVLAEGARLGIPPGRTICTGDVVAYCADPQATVDALRAAGVAVVMGNVEEALAAGAGDCACGFAEGSECDSLAAQWYAFARAEIDGETARWMAGLPRALRFTLGGRRLHVTHGAPSRINRYIFASTPAAEPAAEIAATGCDGVVAGHSGLPFTRVVGGRLWHDAGAAGMPANDGTPRTWYSVLRARDGAVAIEHRALAYDHRAAAARMRQRGLPESYARALETGLWPGLDVLPPAERALSGVAIEPTEIVWRG